jgi:hypothetical protein
MGHLRWPLTLLAIAIAPPAAAQELEPRAYSPSPVGTTFVVLGFGRSGGNVAFDPTIPITNARATLYFPALGLARTFGLFGRQALAEAALPYVWGNASGDLGEKRQHITRSGLADTRLRFAVNLRGSPALTPKQFAAVPHRNFLLAASLVAIAPTGQYDRRVLINIGTNRWALKPELGISYPVRNLYLDVYVGAWFFARNEKFYPGQSTRSQGQMTAVQGHASYTFRPRMWLAFDSTWYGGGAVSINGGPATDRLSNSRAGATLSLPLAARQSMKIAFSRGVTGRIGNRFTTVSIAWQYVFFDRP